MPDFQDLPIDALIEMPGNVNEMDDGEFNALCEGLQASQFCPPIVAAPRGEGGDLKGRWVIIDGNHRYKAWRLLGHATIPAYVLDGLTDAEQQELLNARMAVVRGDVSRDKFTRLWHKVRQRLDEKQAMQVFGITSERKLAQLVKPAQRRLDVTVVADDAIKTLLARTKVVEDLATVVRAALGDGGGTGEFNYLVFQAHGSQIVVVRCTPAEFEAIRQGVERIGGQGIHVPGFVAAALAQPTWTAPMVATEPASTANVEVILGTSDSASGNGAGGDV
jgi:hypothetical protein